MLTRKFASQLTGLVLALAFGIGYVFLPFANVPAHEAFVIRWFGAGMCCLCGVYWAATAGESYCEI